MIIDCHPELCAVLEPNSCKEHALAQLQREPVTAIHAELLLMVGHLAAQGLWNPIGDTAVERMVTLFCQENSEEGLRAQESALAALCDRLSFCAAVELCCDS